MVLEDIGALAVKGLTQAVVSTPERKRIGWPE
jgi:hypothetical protein